MLVPYGKRIIRLTLCTLLPLCLANRSTPRSLNNFVVTSVPYIVDNQSIINEEHGTVDKADTALIAHDAAELACLSSEENRCNDTVIEATFRPYSQDELNKILQKYDKDTIEAQETSNKLANYYSAGNSNNIESSTADPSDKSKAWNVMNYQQTQNYNKNPYDDRMGWVTLEPIAWSSSQVQKWEPNQKPMWPIPSQNNGPWGSPSQYQQQSSYGGYSERPYKKPTYQYQSKPSSSWSSNQNYPKPQYSDSIGNQEIITDGQPGYFPPERPSSISASSTFSAGPAYKPWVQHTHEVTYTETSSRPSTHVVYQGLGSGSHSHHVPEKPVSSSSDGDGHWVLLSSTKGYSVPHNRQRSMARSLDVVEEPKPARSVNSKRMVRLTVLPAEGSNPMITSHNGMIEREATHQTVDEAHREHMARMMRYNESVSESAQIPIIRSSSFHGVPAKVEAVAKPAERRNTILAAVGASMIPATMAMLLPMLLGRKKRSVSEPQLVNLNLKKFSNPGKITRIVRKPIEKRKVLLRETAYY